MSDSSQHRHTAMATEAAPVAPDSECSICHEEYREPKVLRCGHELCAPCLLTLLTSDPDAPCPLCRHPILPPPPPPPGSGRARQSVRSFVDALPTDVATQAWAEGRRLLSGDHACGSCLTRAAASLCLHCRDFLCGPCAAMHGRLSCSRHHRVETLASLSPRTLAGGGRRPPCPAHPSELCWLYCCAHRTSVCVLCTTSTHRNCAQVKDAEERAAETAAALTDVVTALTQEEGRLDRVVLDLDRQDRDTERAAREAEVAIDASFDRLIPILERHRLEAKRDARDKFARRTTEIRDARAGLVRKRGAAAKHRTVAEQGREVMAAHSDAVGEMAAALKRRAEDFRGSAAVPGGGHPAPVVISTATLVLDPRAARAAEKALAGVCRVKVTPAAGVAQVSQFHFHDNRGKNIMLTNNRLTAERTSSDTLGGIVISSQPMMPHRLYEVQLDERETSSRFHMVVGAVTSDPEGMAIPDKANGWRPAVVFQKRFVEVHRKVTRRDVGRRLGDLPRGSRVGVMVDDGGCLHLYVDGQDQGHAGCPVSRPCFALFHVWGPYRKVTAMPVSVVP